MPRGPLRPECRVPAVLFRRLRPASLPCLAESLTESDLWRRPVKDVLFRFVKLQPPASRGKRPADRLPKNFKGKCAFLRKVGNVLANDKVSGRVGQFFPQQIQSKTRSRRSRKHQPPGGVSIFGSVLVLSPASRDLPFFDSSNCYCNLIRFPSCPLKVDYLGPWRPRENRGSDHS